MLIGIKNSHTHLFSNYILISMWYSQDESFHSFIFVHNLKQSQTHHGSELTIALVLSVSAATPPPRRSRSRCRRRCSCSRRSAQQPAKIRPARCTANGGRPDWPLKTENAAVSRNFPTFRRNLNWRLSLQSPWSRRRVKIGRNRTESWEKGYSAPGRKECLDSTKVFHRAK